MARNEMSKSARALSKAGIDHSDARRSGSPGRKREAKRSARKANRRQSRALIAEQFS